MNKKGLIAIVVIVGLGVGLGWSMLSNSNAHKNMKHTEHMHSDMEHTNHSEHMHAKTKPNDHQSMNHSKMQVPELFRASLDKSLMGYFSMQQALSKDDLSNAKKSGFLILSNINKQVELEGITKKLWDVEKPKVKQALKDINSAKTIKDARSAFEALSTSMEVLVVHFGGPKNHHIAKYHCPMVDGNRGASWLQNTEGTQNPYYGSQMFGCGSKIKEL
jgi:Cu(I)/Ag(I) efflux system membrane fusion protein